MRAVSCGPDTTTTDIATLSVINPANIVSQPANATVCPNENATFSLAAIGTNLSYQWQVSTDAGISYNNIPLATITLLNLPGVSLAMNDYRYRVIMNGDCTVNLASAPGILIVNKPVAITTAQANNAACSGTSTSFSVSATGTSLTYQWQESVNGGVFVNLPNSGIYSGANSSVLNISSVVPSMNGNAYRVTVTGAPCGSVNSLVYGLIVYPLPSVVINARSQGLTPAINTNIFAIPVPAGAYTYRWYLNDLLLNGPGGPDLPVYIDGIGNYKVAVTNANGCTALSNTISIVDSLSSELFIYPNPSNGRFQVRYYLPGGSADRGRTISVYDAKGSRVFSKQYNVLGGYSRMDVNMTQMQSGIYMVELRDAGGKRLGKAPVLIR
jgi:hypothetical protein